MRSMPLAISLLAGLSPLAACGESTSSPPADTRDASDTQSPTDTADTADAPDSTDTDDTSDTSNIEDSSPTDATDTSAPANHVTILHTGDERGRLLPREEVVAGTAMIRGGAANVAGWWLEREDYAPATHIVLSSGSSWIGSPSATWLRGKSVVEVFGLMGYDAAVLGTRDFDFGRAAMLARIDEATYPFLSANTRTKATGELAPFVQATTIIRVGSIDVAIIGLMDVTSDANAADLADLTFADLADTIDLEAGLARAAGAEIVIALGACTLGAMEDALETLTEPIDLAFAARSGNVIGREAGGVPVFVSGQYLDGYHAIRLSHDPTSGAVTVTSAEFVDVVYPKSSPNPITPVAAVETAVAKWETLANTDLAEEIGYTTTGLARPSWPLANWVLDSWLAAFPEADLAIQNSGGLQAAIEPGAITVGDVVATMPFENYILQVPMTGAKVRAALTAMVANCGPIGTACFVAVAGLTYKRDLEGDLMITLAEGGPLVDDTTYDVLVNNYVFVGGSGFPVDASLVPTATGQHMRDPVLAWTRALGTSTADPLEDHIDATPRNE